MSIFVGKVSGIADIVIRNASKERQGFSRKPAALFCAPLAASLRSPLPPCVSAYGLRRGADLASVGRFLARRVAYCKAGVLRIASVLQIAMTSPPRLRRCPPSLVGFLARIWASRFASGALVKLTADLEAPWCKTSTPKKPPVSPHFGGQRRASARRGGLVTRSARPSRRAKRQPPNQRQVCPPPETVGRDTGGKARGLPRALPLETSTRTSDSEGRGGRGGHVLALCKTCNKKPTSGGQREARGACSRSLLDPQKATL